MDTLPPHFRNGKFSYPSPSTKISGIYTITNTVNGNQYVGSSQDIQLRWQQHRTHLHTKDHHSTYLQHAWNKHSEDAFVFEVIELTTPKQCVEREQYWIDTLHPAYNILSVAGSPLGHKASAVTRAKLSEIAKNRTPPMAGKHHSEATKEKMRKPKSEEYIAKMRERKTSEETRLKMSNAKKGKDISAAARAANIKANTGRPLSPERKENLRLVNLGKKHTPERIAKNSASHLGKVPANKGKKMSPEARANVIAAQQARRARERASNDTA